MLVVRVLRAVRSVSKLIDARAFDKIECYRHCSRDLVVVVVAGPMPEQFVLAGRGLRNLIVHCRHGMDVLSVKAAPYRGLGPALT